MRAVWFRGAYWPPLVGLLLTTLTGKCRQGTSVLKFGDQALKMRHGRAMLRLEHGAWDCSWVVSVCVLSLPADVVGLFSRQTKGIACGEWADSGLFPQGMEGLACITQAGLGLGSAGAAKDMRECCEPLVSILLTAVLTSCLSSILRGVLFPLNCGKDPEGCEQMEGGESDSVRAVSDKGECIDALCELLMLTATSLGSRFAFTALTDGAAA
jgi:hypothetical protein